MPTKRTRVKPPSLDLHDITALNSMQKAPAGRTPTPMLAVTPLNNPDALPAMPSDEEAEDSDDSIPSDIRFRTATTITIPPEAFQIQVARRQSLVKPEDYMPPTSAKSFNENLFNPYQSPSWATKPEGFEGDLASPNTSPKVNDSKHNSMPVILAQIHNNLEQSSPVTRQVEYDTLDSKRMLGGKELVKAGEWRRKLHLDPTKGIEKSGLETGHIIVETDPFDEKGAAVDTVYIGKIPEPTTVALERGRNYTWQKMLTVLVPIVVVLLQLATLVYLAVRAYYIVMTQKITKQSYTAAWMFWLIEVFYGIQLALHSAKAYQDLRARAAKKLRLKGDAFLPTVDVLILATGQHDQIVMDTAMAASKMDWPIDRIRILVLDEHGSHELQRRVESYASHRALHLSYHRKLKSVRFAEPAPSRSGLINFGLTETRSQGRLAGEYTLVLEADCIPEVDILRALLPQMLKNARLGLVQADQGFYNIPERVSASFGTMLSVTETQQFARSGFVMRRCAVDDIGGFPFDSSIEDGQLTAFLLGKGYLTQRCHEVLQFGLVSDSWAVQIQQYMRKCTGPFRTLKAGKFAFAGGRFKHLSFGKRFQIYTAAVAPLGSFLTVLAALLFPTALFLDEFLVPILTMAQLWILIRLLFIVTILQRLVDLLYYGDATIFMLQQRWSFSSVYRCAAIVQQTIPRRFMTPAKDGWQAEEGPRERDARSRKSTSTRLMQIVLTPAGVIHLALATLTMIGLGYALALAIKHSEGHGGRSTFLLLLLTVCWPTLHFIPTLAGCFTSLTYALFPPTVAPRDHLLLREPITGLAKAALENRRTRPFSQQHGFEILMTYLSSCYLTALFILSFFTVLDV